MPISGGELPEFDPSEADGTGVIPQMSFGCLVGVVVFIAFVGASKGLVKLVDWYYDDGDQPQQVTDKKIQKQNPQKSVADTLNAIDTLRIMDTLKNQKSK